MVALPAVTPVTVPETEPMVATEVLPLVHVPPLTELVSVVLPAIQMVVDMGEIAAGVTLTVMVFNAKQPAAFV